VGENLHVAQNFIVFVETVVTKDSV